MAENLAQRSRKWHKKNQIGETGGERKKNPSADPDIEETTNTSHSGECLRLLNIAVKVGKIDPMCNKPLRLSVRALNLTDDCYNHLYALDISARRYLL